ncbi:MAG: DUF2786 domain-containing protein [Egibacteraceae bacterium]
MGKQNKQRRAAKKRRQRSRRPPPRPGAQGPGVGHTAAPPPGAGHGDTASPPFGPDDPLFARNHDHARTPPPPPPPPLEDLVWGAAYSWNTDAHFHESLLAELLRHGPAASAAVLAQVRTAIGQLWGRGWTPADVVHAVARHQSAGHADTIARHVVADGAERTRRGQELHARWVDQLAVLAEGRPPGNGGDLRIGVALLGFLSGLPELPRVIPPPGAPASGADQALRQARGLDARMLARVRALLAKAESTEFDEEAEALTAKAQELIARHAIDEALLHAGDDVGEPSTRRIPVDDPYADAKSQLLTEVAGANRCRTVYTPTFAWVTAFGYEGDLDAVELLAASLLAQATSAMARQGSVRDAAGRSRTRSFRRAFLLGFAHRIGERLTAATDGQVADTPDQGRLLPVLAARDDRLHAAETAAFPHLVRQTRTVSNGGGWVAGRAAADRADLGMSAGALRDAAAR